MTEAEEQHQRDAAHYRQVVHDYVAAVNAGDVEAILALFADDAEAHDPMFQNAMRGKAELRAFYEQVAGAAKMEIAGPLCVPMGNVIATVIKGALGTMKIDVITITTFDDAGLIKHYAGYWGPTNVQQD